MFFLIYSVLIKECVLKTAEIISSYKFKAFRDISLSQNTVMEEYRSVILVNEWRGPVGCFYMCL